MARQNINIGTTANDGTGDPLRTAFNKVNENFVEVYANIGGTTFIGGTIANPTTFQSTAASTSTTSGAVKVAGGLGVQGNVHASVFHGVGTGLTGIPGGSVTGVVASATSAGTATTAASATTAVSAGTATTAISATTAATVTDASQPNITSVGNLSTLTVTGNVTAGNVLATAFYGDGSTLTGIALPFDGILARANVIIRSAEVINVQDNVTIEPPGSPGGAQYTDTFTADEDGQIFYYSAGSTGSITSDWTINLGGLDLEAGHATSVTAIIDQGATGYFPNEIKIDGVAQTVKWQGGAAPTANANQTDVIIYSIICLRSGPPKEYLVLGQLVTFA